MFVPKVDLPIPLTTVCDILLRPADFFSLLVTTAEPERGSIGHTPGGGREFSLLKRLGLGHALGVQSKRFHLDSVGITENTRFHRIFISPPLPRKEYLPTLIPALSGLSLVALRYLTKCRMYVL